MHDLISRQAAIDALWKALYEYEDKTEKQFIESDELDVTDWIHHRIFVQNMSDIDRQTILNLPSVQPQQTCEYWDGESKFCALCRPPAQPQSGIIRCKDCKYWMPYDWMFSEIWRSQNINDYSEDEIGCQYCDMTMKADDFCSRAERRTDE